MSFVAAVTQPGWISTIRTHGFSGEVNFWRPGRQPVAATHIGTPLLFVQKGRTPRPMPGLGIIDRYEQLSIREAWVRWRTRNGVLSLDEFIESLTRVAQETSTNGGGMTNRIEGADTVIGCLVLRNIFLYSIDGAPTVDQVLPDFPRNVVSYKIYPGDLPELLAPHALQIGAVENPPASPWAMIDPAERDAIERHAMLLCETTFRGWQVDDVSKPGLAASILGNEYPGYDVLVRKAAAEFHVEVKGTKLERPLITITSNELRTACSGPLAKLLVVSAIRTYHDEEGWHAVGGLPVLYDWATPDTLSAILNGLTLGEPHALQPKAVEWSLNVRSTDLVRVHMGQI